VKSPLSTLSVPPFGWLSGQYAPSGVVSEVKHAAAINLPFSASGPVVSSPELQQSKKKKICVLSKPLNQESSVVEGVS
jgi:hypothetical protein